MYKRGDDGRGMMMQAKQRRENRHGRMNGFIPGGLDVDVLIGSKTDDEWNGG